MIPSEKLTIETPEQTDLEFHLAGIGSRLLAFVFDTLVQVIIYLGLFVAAAIVLPSLGRYWIDADKWVVGMFILIFFVVYTGYFAIFETAWKGQTPGKRQAGIRVIKATGQPIGAFEAIARNLMRAVDSFPGMYAVGMVSMFFSNRNCRLGDLVAGTVVVHETAEATAYPIWNEPAQAAPAGAALEVARLTPQDLQVIETFLARKIDLPPEVRQATARKLADKYVAKMELADSTEAQLRPEDFLEGLVRQLRGAARYA